MPHGRCLYRVGTSSTQGRVDRTAAAALMCGVEQIPARRLVPL